MNSASASGRSAAVSFFGSPAGSRTPPRPRWPALPPAGRAAGRRAPGRRRSRAALLPALVQRHLDQRQVAGLAGDVLDHLVGQGRGAGLLLAGQQQRLLDRLAQPRLAHLRRGGSGRHCRRRRGGRCSARRRCAGGSSRGAWCRPRAGRARRGGARARRAARKSRRGVSSVVSVHSSSNWSTTSSREAPAGPDRRSASRIEPGSRVRIALPSANTMLIGRCGRRWPRVWAPSTSPSNGSLPGRISTTCHCAGLGRRPSGIGQRTLAEGRDQPGLDQRGLARAAVADDQDEVRGLEPLDQGLGLVAAAEEQGGVLGLERLQPHEGLRHQRTGWAASSRAATRIRSARPLAVPVRRTPWYCRAKGGRASRSPCRRR